VSKTSAAEPLVFLLTPTVVIVKPYGVRGGYQAVFTDAAVVTTWTAGHDGHATTTLTEYTEQGKRGVELPTRDAYTAVTDHVIACCQAGTHPGSARPACLTPSSSPSTSTPP
jgi:hypothetical protein